MSILIALLPLLTPQAPQAPQQVDPPIPADTKVVTTDSGLKYSVLKAGAEKDAHPKLGDTVKVHYTGWFPSGKVFDSSAKRGPASFKVGQVIEGWNEGLALMNKGAKFKFSIPWQLAYGERGAPPNIPPKADLIFVVELLEITPGPDLPVFRQLEEPTSTASGLKYEVVEAGKGDAPKPEERWELSYAYWTTDGKLKGWDEIAGNPIKASAQQMQLPFLKEAPLMMKPGAVYLFEVPAALLFGDTPRPGLPAGSVTIWKVKMERVLRPLPVPPFVLPAEDKSKSTASGLRYQVVKKGTGAAPKMGSKVTVHYAGWLTSGKLFDSSFQRGETATFRLGEVISGWNEGLQLMKEGAIYRFLIPWKLAYGEAGRPPRIPAKADLVFLVELQKAL